VQIATAKFPTGAQNAILVSGLNFPDALSASYLAGLNSAPILLTDPATLSTETSKALATLHTKNVWIVGGTDAVAPAVATAVAAMTSTAPIGGPIVVNRIAGQTRYDTMQAVDTSAAVTQVGVIKGKATAIIAQGLDFADALASSGLSYKAHLPIILTDPASLITQASATLTALNIGQVIIAGGTAAISAATEQSINAMGIPTLARAAGTDRTDTAAKLAAWSVANAGFTNNEVVLTRGDNFPDALAGGVYAGDPKPILLTLDPNTLGGFTANYLTAFSAQINTITTLGGFEAVSDAVVNEASLDASNNGNGGGGGAGGAIGGGGGNGGFGNVSPASNPVTAGPNLTSSNTTTDGVQFVFDKSITAITNVNGFGVFGPDTKAATGTFATGTNCVIDPNGVAVDCHLPGGTSFSLAEVDGGSVAGPGGLPNVVNIAVLKGGNVPTPPQLLLKSAAVSSVAFNSIAYTFTGTVGAVGSSALFGFSTSDGNTSFVGPGTAASIVFGGATVTVTFPPQDGVTNATYFFVRDGAVAGGAISDVGTLPSQRPNLVSVTRVLNSPQQFVFTVDKPSTVSNVPSFELYRNAGSGLPYVATTAVPQSSTQFLATFTTAPVIPPGPGTDQVLSTSNTASVVLGAIDWAVTGPPTALKLTGAPFAANAVGGVAVAAASTAVANGPVLQAVSLSVGSSQGVFTFDRPIAAGSVVPADFFLVNNNDSVVPGTGTVAVSDRQVTIQFPAGTTSNAVGGGLIGTFELQPGVNGGAAAVAAADSAGNPAVGSSVASSLTA
jgi:putative cell wall-binding protein